MDGSWSLLLYIEYYKTIQMMNTLKISEIIPDENQPRKYFAVEKMASLKDSIKRHGIITPLVVSKQGEKYLLIDGERRFRAATELRLREVPVQIVSSKHPLERMIEQFHIQEQHESWSQSEKALAIMEISEVSKKPLQEVCAMLSIDKRTMRSYLAFAKLFNKDAFVDANLGISNAEKIAEMKRLFRKISEDSLNKSFSKADENKLEKILISMISKGYITSKNHYSRIKDSISTNPKLLDKFMENEITDIDELFVSSNARGAGHLRNMIHNCGYVNSHGAGYLREPNVALSPTDVSAIKSAVKVCQLVLKLAGKED